MEMRRKKRHENGNQGFEDVLPLTDCPPPQLCVLDEWELLSLDRLDRWLLFHGLGIESYLSEELPNV